jgi:surfactin synthase thioesterase subunit
MSSVRFSPITGQDASWKQLGAVLQAPASRHPGKILFFVGAKDPIIIPDELRPDAEALLGSEKMEWRVVEGAHDFPITESAEVVRDIVEFWGL